MTKLKLISLIIGMLFFAACTNPGSKTEAEQEPPKTEDTATADEDLPDPVEGIDDEDTTYHGGEIEVVVPAHDSVPEKKVVLKPGEYTPNVFADSLTMEKTYASMLQPVVSLKTSDPKTYWFLVSWLNTAYKTPNWDGYNDDYYAWREKALRNGVDCSGFSRVMLDRVFGKKIVGGSSGIYAKQVDKISRADLQKGDLVFFKIPGSESNRIVHVGVYLQDGFFAHATSTRSAKLGRGMSINSLDEDRWRPNLVGCGRPKEAS